MENEKAPYDVGDERVRESSGTAARHKANNDKAETDGEFLSGFYRDDKLIPVITVVFYFGSDDWNAPRSLYDMFPQTNKALRRLVPDYPINLIAPLELTDEEIETFVTDIGPVIQCLKYANDRKRFKEIVSDNPAFKHISRRAADVINVMTKANLTFPENEEEVNMCLAIEGIREEGREEGILEILHTLVEKGLLSVEDAAENSGLSLEEFIRSKP